MSLSDAARAQAWDALGEAERWIATLRETSPTYHPELVNQLLGRVRDALRRFEEAVRAA